MYKVQKYNDVIQGKGAEALKRYTMIEKLSKGFTVLNETARKMDDLLADELASMEKEPPSPRPMPTPAPAPKAKPASRATDLEAKFEDLFTALKAGAGNGAQQDKDGFKSSLREALEDFKISMGHLDSGVQKMLYESSAKVVVKYELPPPAKPIPFDKPPIAAFQQIVDDIMTGNNVFLVGGAGTGKTYLAENLVAKAALGRPHLTINCSQWTSPTEIIGGQTMDGYVEGKLIEAWEKGCVLILDELPKIDPNTAGLLNDALAKTRIPNAVIFNSRKESFAKHDNFAVIATGNVYPDKESMAYGANNKQDLSLLDRFSGSVHIIEKNPAIERQIVQNDMVWSVCDKLRDAIQELKYEAQVSLRLMMNCRDAYNLEMARVKDHGKNGVTADQGKTFKSTIDSYLSTFTEVQRGNLAGKLKYREILDHHQYRRLDTTKKIY